MLKRSRRSRNPAGIGTWNATADSPATGGCCQSAGRRSPPTVVSAAFTSMPAARRLAHIGAGEVFEEVEIPKGRTDASGVGEAAPPRSACQRRKRTYSLTRVWSAGERAGQILNKSIR